MLSTQDVCSKFDLSSVKTLFTGAAPLGVETANDFQKLYPNVLIRQGYGKFQNPSHPTPKLKPKLTHPGLTETCTVVSSTHPHDIFLGSSGALIPGFEARIMTPENEEITEYNTPGELVVRGPSVVLGYLNNDKATKETFEDGWMRTGDEAVIRVSPKGVEHVFIVDRIKELIKVKVRHCFPSTSTFRGSMEQNILTINRVFKLRPPNWKLISLRTRLLPTWRLLPFRMIGLERCRRRLLLRLLERVLMRMLPRRLLSMLRIIRRDISGLRVEFGLWMLFLRVLVGRFCGDCFGIRRRRRGGRLAVRFRFRESDLGVGIRPDEMNILFTIFTGFLVRFGLGLALPV
jgi:hypothetical protein